jgi:hypothetical protein
MRTRTSTSVLAAAVVLAAWTAIWAVTSGLPPRVEPRIHEEIGRALAQEAVRLLGPGGSVTVLARDTGTFKQPAIDIALGGFTRELKKNGGKPPVVQALQVDPLRPLQVPAGDLHELLRRGAVGDVVVSFMGAPLLSDEQRASLGAVKPKVVAFCPGGILGIQELKALGGQGLLHAAVVSRPAKAGTPSAPDTGREPFDALYERLDPAALGGSAIPGTAR